MQDVLNPATALQMAWLLPFAPMSSQTPSIDTGPLRGCVAVDGHAVVREIWPYKPVAHSSARR
jgi:hypothetical protein